MTVTRENSDWIALDWGTSHVRAWLVSAEGKIKDKLSSKKGMASLESDEFEPALIDLIGDYLDRNTQLQIVACGMVGSRQGWCEARYADVKGSPISADNVVTVPVQDERFTVEIVAGLKQDEPADVMRGEETQIAGFLSLHPGFTGVVCLPGTHTKWVTVKNGLLESFQTIMTGELFALLSRQSVLRFNLKDELMDVDAFDRAASIAFKASHAIMKGLFGLRARALLEDVTNAVTRAELSGLLIGGELASVQDTWRGQKTAIIGSRKLSRLYDRALEQQGAETLVLDADDMTVRGLHSVFQDLQEKRKCLAN